MFHFKITLFKHHPVASGGSSSKKIKETARNYVSHIYVHIVVRVVAEPGTVVTELFLRFYRKSEFK